MGIHTLIEWCDSTTNGMSGCDGCELWNPKAGIRHCYAGILVERYAGRKGWPASFDKPQHFPGRIEQALLWPDLTGKERPDKPWLNGLPRLVFLDDMGDTFTESLDPRSWLTALVPRMAESPHVWIFLTKRPRRMLEYFSELGHIPRNFWMGTTVTSQASITRLRHLQRLRDVDPGCTLWCSFEPLLGPVDAGPYLRPQWYHQTRPAPAGWIGAPAAMDFVRLRKGLDWAVIGGESGAGARPCALEWIEDLAEQCFVAGVPVFVKQLGSNAISEERALWRARLKDRKGGDWSEWPGELKVRQMPKVEAQ